MSVRRILAAICCMVMAMTVEAVVITPAQALTRVKNLSDVSHLPQVEKAQRVFTIIGAEKAPACYVMSDAAGYVVVSADDRGPALLAYGDTPISSIDEVPDAMAYWLRYYASQIEASATTGPTHAPQRQFAPISPLISTKWGQDAPYNALCPTISRRKCPTGCTATAMAQVIKYHSWPERGVGQYSYSSQGMTYAFDYDSTTFDFSLMLDSYTSSATNAQKEAVAQLMYGCGVAADMQYGPDASGAYLFSALNGLIRNFRYSPSACLTDRDKYPVLRWEEMIHNSLSNCGPVIYCGYTQNANGQADEGHTFIIDGYASDGYFHINWGWSGDCDGYFLLNVLDTYGDGTNATVSAYGFGQAAILNLEPLREGDTPNDRIGISMNSAMTLTQTPTALGQEVTFKANYSNTSSIDLDGVTFGLCFNGGEAVFADTQTDIAKDSRINNYSVTVVLPQDLAPGTYIMDVVFRYGGSDTYHLVEAQRSNLCVLVVEADGSVAVNSANKYAPLPQADNLKLITDIYPDKDFDVTFVIKAPGMTEYSGAITMLLMTDADASSIVAKGNHITLNLMPEEEITVNYVGAFTGITPGSYYLAVGAMQPGSSWAMKPTYALISEPVAVEVTDAPTGAFAIEAGDYEFHAVKADPEAIGGTLTIEFDALCTSGYSSGQFYTDVYESATTKMLGNAFSNTMPFSAGTTRRVSINVELESLSEGGQYFCRLMFYDTKYIIISNRINISPLQFEAGIDSVTTDPGTPLSTEIYDLSGRRLPAPPATGVYILLTRYPTDIMITKIAI